MGIPYKVALFIISAVFLGTDLVFISKKKIDAGTGIFWAVLLAVFLIMDCVADLRALSRINQIVAIALTVIMICAGIVMYSHEVELTELKKKNNELAIQIALINDYLLQLKQEDRTYKEVLSVSERST